MYGEAGSLPDALASPEPAAQAEPWLRDRVQQRFYLALHHSVIVERKLNDFVVKRYFVVSED